MIFVIPIAVVPYFSIDGWVNAYDDWSGNTARTQEIYDALPSVDMREATAGNLTGDHAALNERGDILDLLQAKATAEYFENKIKTENDPERVAYYKDHMQAAKDNFELSVESMDKGQLDDVKDYLATYNQYMNSVAASNATTSVQDMATNPEIYGTYSTANQSRMAI